MIAESKTTKEIEEILDALEKRKIARRNIEAKHIKSIIYSFDFFDNFIFDVEWIEFSDVFLMTAELHCFVKDLIVKRKFTPQQYYDAFNVGQLHIVVGEMTGFLGRKHRCET